MQPPPRFSLSYAHLGRNHGKADVALCAYFPETRRRYYIHFLNMEFESKDWSRESQRLKTSHPNHRELNQYFDSVLKKVNDYYIETVVSGKKFTPTVYKAFMGGRVNGSSFTEWGLGIVAKYRHLNKSTIDDYVRALRKVDEYGGNRFSDFDGQWAPKFETWMRGKGIAQNTRALHHHKIAHLCRLALHSKFIEENPYLHYRPQSIRTRFEYLSRGDVRRLMEMNYAKYSDKDIVRTWFLFSLCTGLRFSDTVRVLKKPEDFLFKDGEYMELRISSKKTGVMAYIPVSDIFEGVGLEMLKKYDFRVPMTTSEKANRHLKEIAADIGCNFRVTYHTSRHTCGTLMAANGASEYMIMSVMGLTSPKIAQRYIHLSGVRIREKARTIKF